MKAKPTYHELEKENQVLRQRIEDFNSEEINLLINKYKTQNEELILAKEKEEEIEKKYRTIFNNASIGILIADTTKMNFSFANPAICNMLGYTEEELIKMNVLDIHPKESLDSAISNFQAHAKKEKILATNQPCQRKDGSIFYANVNTTSFTINKIEYNVGFFTDISEKRNADKKIQKQSKEYASLSEEYKIQNEELKKAIEKAEKSEQRYKFLSNAGFEAIFISENGICIEQNLTASKMFGYSDKEVIGMFATEIFADESKETVKTNLLSGNPESYEVVALKKDGTTFHAEIQGITFKSNKKNLRVTAIRDITAKKKVESDMIQSKNKFKTIVETVNDWIWEIDKAGVYTYSSPNVFSILGYSNDEVIGKTPFDLMPLDERKRVKNIILDIIRLKKNINKVENINIHKNGSLITLETSGIPFFDTKGELLGYRGVDRDITYRKKAETEINKMSMAVEQSANSIVITDTEGIIEYTNPKFSELSGYSKEEVLGNNISILKAGTQAKEYYIKLWETITAGKIWKGEFHNKTKTGDSLWEKASITPLKNNKGEITNYIAIKEDITAGKNAEKQLNLAKEIIKENKIYLSNILKTANEGFWIIDTTAKTLEVNAEMCKILGLDKEKIVGKSIFEFVDDKNSKIFKEQLKKRADGVSSNYEIELLTSSGKNLACLFKATPIFNSDKERIGSFAMVTDISKLKNAYNKLEDKNKELILAKEKAVEGEIRFKNFANLLPQTVYECDTQGKLIFVNEHALRLFGYSTEDVKKGVNIVNTVISKDRDRVLKNLQNLFKGVENKNIEYTALNKRGKKFPVLIYASIVLKENIPVGLRGIIVDITDRKKAEKELKQSEKNYRELFDKATDAIYIQDKNGYFIDVNQGAIDMYGYPKEKMIGKKPFFLSAPGKNDLNEIDTFVKKAYNGEAQQFDFWGKRKNGEVFPKIVRSKNGFYLGKKVIISFAIDISDLKKVELELIKSKEKAEESDRLKTEFINNMSHEIRTPMNGIIGFSQLLNTPDLSDEKLNNYISIIQNSGNQLMRIIDDILEISKLGTKQVKAIERKVCLNDLLLEMFSIFDIKAKENKTPLYLKKGSSDEESIILTDESKLTKILSNLLENALKFTNSGYIEFGYQIVNNRINIYVKDTGIGIKPEKQKIIFERFSQADKEVSIQVGGLGLGLSIAKENVELIGGTITLTSEKEKGSTFTITIPYKPAKTEIVNISDQKKSKLQTKENTILIAEDEEINFLYIETLLETFNLDIKILHARTGKDAVEICETQKYIDLILMDIKMPIMNGYEATKRIKKSHPNIPIVAQTAYSSTEHKRKAEAAGCDDFITKPINQKSLIAIINNYLNK